MNQESKVFSTQIVSCQMMCVPHELDIDTPSVQALCIVYTDGHLEVKCPCKDKDTGCEYVNER